MSKLFDAPYVAVPLAMLFFGAVVMLARTCSGNMLQRECLERRGSWINDSCRFEREEDPVDDSRED